MVLTATSLCHYLLERGLVSRSSLVDGDFEVYDLSRRNRVFRVLRGSHPGYIVKQVKEWKASSIATVEREAGFYSLLRTEEKLTPLRRFLPQCYSYDGENQALVFELAGSFEETASAVRSVEFARVVGESLRQWHQEARAIGGLQAFGDYDPWMMSFHLKPEDHFDVVSPANSELLRVVRREAAFTRGLDALREQWRSQTMIHGDMRWNNCVLSANEAPRFIDWEMAGWGDPLWDAAGILQEYLNAWVRDGRVVEEITPGIRAFWAAYGAGRGSLNRAVGYAAVRLIQSGFENQRTAERMTASSVRLLQAALNILEKPEESIAVFFENT